MVPITHELEPKPYPNSEAVCFVPALECAVVQVCLGPLRCPLYMGTCNALVKDLLSASKWSHWKVIQPHFPAAQTPNQHRAPGLP